MGVVKKKATRRTKIRRKPPPKSGRAAGTLARQIAKLVGSRKPSDLSCTAVLWNDAGSPQAVSIPNAPRPPGPRMIERSELLHTALANRHRVRLLARLVAAPATYAALKSSSKLQPGPLYHHLRQLERAGMIRIRQRNQYEITRGGRSAYVLSGAMLKLCTG